MTNRATRRRTTGRTTNPSTVPHPPAPAWAHWWDPTRRRWFRHDPQVEAFIRQLSETVPAPATPKATLK